MVSMACSKSPGQHYRFQTSFTVTSLLPPSTSPLFCTLSSIVLRSVIRITELFFFLPFLPIVSLYLSTMDMLYTIADPNPTPQIIQPLSIDTHYGLAIGGKGNGPAVVNGEIFLSSYDG